MAESRKADAGQAEVESVFEDAMKKGYYGESPSPIPNKAYSLESGPDSPSALDGHVASREAQLKVLKGKA